MVEASCHCGAVRIEIATAPETVTQCGCSICSRLGTLWAYYPPASVRLIPPSGATEIYSWGEKKLEFHRCRICGNTTHWAAVDKTVSRMGVNARLMPPEIVRAATLKEISGPG
jgi:hypothetical protein